VGTRLEKVKQAWRRGKPYLPWVLGGLVVLTGFILALKYFIFDEPKMRVPDLYWLSPKVRFDMENEARRTNAYIIGGCLAVIGIILTFWRIRTLEKQVMVAQEGQITERFTRAIEQLGSDRMEVRLGGIYALERIANDSDKDYWPIMETLTAYVRERAPWRDIPQEKKVDASATEPASPEQESDIKPATDIQAVLTVLGRRKYRYDQKEEKGRLNLTNTDLRGLDLMSANIEGADLRRAHLERANLWGVHLEGTDLALAHLEGANLTGVHMEEAILTEAHLEKAILVRSNFERSFLGGTHFEGILYFIEVNLKGANLQNATGLTREQLANAILDETTVLPDCLQEQPPKTKGRKLDIRSGPGTEYPASKSQRVKGELDVKKP
jgi:hypothetical protein